ncbi:MAG: replication-associated recombination protein A [Bdellovibrionales bacterium]|nr:replication-associated recombination protein A [Bdellovibrionales bacterium]
MDLFTHASGESPTNIPLAEKLRPKQLSEILGQEAFLKKYKALFQQLENGHFMSLILWGPPGSGKTSFVKALVSKAQNIFLVEENAIDLGSKRLKEIGEQARYQKVATRKSTLLFIDEIHRLNRSQQDVLLPFVERGDLILIGATTENPSYELNSALVSRCRLVIFEKLSDEALKGLVQKACEALGIHSSELFDENVLNSLVQSSGGDGRRLINTIEEIAVIRTGQPELFPLVLETYHQLNLHQGLRYDKDRDEHYDTISAFIKSVRGSDPDAAVYYLARMLEGGEDPVFIARRLVILASEDIGNAEPHGLNMAVSALQAVELIGMPEARICLSQATTYLASAPKSNRAYLAINAAMEEVKSSGNLPIPKSLRSAQTALARRLGYGKDYKYSHEGHKGYENQVFLPEEIKDKKFYEPVERGFEKKIKEYLAWMKK